MVFLHCVLHGGGGGRVAAGERALGIQLTKADLTCTIKSTPKKQEVGTVSSRNIYPRFTICPNFKV